LMYFNSGRRGSCASATSSTLLILSFVCPAKADYHSGRRFQSATPSFPLSPTFVLKIQTNFRLNFADGSATRLFRCLWSRTVSFYILHIFLIHTLALIVAAASGANWRLWITPDVVFMSHLTGWGYSLWTSIPYASPSYSRRIRHVHGFSHLKDCRRDWWFAYLGCSHSSPSKGRHSR
jgi:hypothetical protein